MRLLYLSLTVLWLATTAVSQPLNTERLVERMLEVGADGAALADLARAPADPEMLAALGPERGEQLRQAWSRAFAYEQVQGDVVHHIAEHERGADVARGLDWLRKTAVSRATAPMRAATGPAFDREFGQWMLQVRDGEVDIDEARLEAIVRISERSGEERVGEVVLALAEASVRGAHAVAPPEERPPLEEALGRLRSMGPTLTAQAVVQNQLYLYYVLRELSLQQLEAYITALDEPAGRWYVGAMGEAISYAIDRSTTRLVRQARAATGS